jgi:hypothetical protein
LFSFNVATEVFHLCIPVFNVLDLLTNNVGQDLIEWKVGAIRKLFHLIFAYAINEKEEYSHIRPAGKSHRLENIQVALRVILPQEMRDIGPNLLEEGTDPAKVIDLLTNGARDALHIIGRGSPKQPPLAVNMGPSYLTISLDDKDPRQ